jgi:hypothetical protein
MRKQFKLSPPHLALLVMLGELQLTGAIVFSWFTVQGIIHTIFANLKPRFLFERKLFLKPIAVKHY